MPRLSRRTFIAFTLAAATVAQAAESGKYQLTVASDRKDAVYAKGDAVKFRIGLKLDGKGVDGAEIAWTTTKDGVPPNNSGKVNLASGSGEVSARLEEAGFLQCRASFKSPDGKTITAMGGAAVDPLKIAPSMPVPDDFDAFWAAQKKQLAAVPVNARLTPVKWPSTSVEAFDLQADSIGAPVSGYFVRPVSAKPKSLPIILTVHGAGVRNSSLGGAAGWAAKGFLAMDINAHGLPNGEDTPFYTDLANGELKDYRTRGKESRDTVYFRGMFLRLVRALDVLTAQPEWDGRTVVVHGSSQGGYQSIVAAGLDPRVTFFAAGVPAGCDHTGFKVGRINGWPKFIATGEKPADNVVDAVRYYDVVNFATRAKVQGIVTVGFIDTTCPPSSVYAAYNALPGKKAIFNDIPSGHTNSPQASKAMQDAILKHAEEMKKR